MPQLIAAANACAATTSEASAKKEIVASAAALAEASARMIASAKAQAEGKQEGAPVLAAYNDATVAGAQLLAGTFFSIEFLLLLSLVLFAFP